MNTIIDVRVSPRMRQFLLANKKNKLHPDQKREIVFEPLISILLLMVPVIILLRGYLFTIFVGGLWMIGALGVLYGVFQLYRRSRRYARVKIFYGIYHTGEYLAPRWQFWKAISLMSQSGDSVRFKRSLAAEKYLQPNQNYIVYYVKENDDHILLSYAPTNHPEIDHWKP